MALDNRSIVITLKLDKNSEDENPTDTESKKKEIDKDAGQKAMTAYFVMESIEAVGNEVVAWAEYEWNRELTLHDDYIGQRNKNVAMTYINRATSSVSSLAFGAIAGAKVGAAIGMGPVGAAIGVAIGLATTIAGIIRSNVQGQDQQNIAIKQMDAQLDFTRSRAGWSLQAASIGEDL